MVDLKKIDPLPESSVRTWCLNKLNEGPRGSAYIQRLATTILAALDERDRMKVELERRGKADGQ